VPGSRLTQVTALVLRSREYGEGSRLITLFTREEGKLLAVARGVMKPRAKLAGTLQHFALLEAHLAAGRRFDVITQARVLEAFYGLRQDYDAFAYANYFAELFDACLEERQPHPALYDLLGDALHRLVEGGDLELLARYTEISLVAMLGYLPQLTRCAHCQIPLARRGEDGHPVWPTWVGFSSSQGGALCPDCLKTVPGARRVAAGTLQVTHLLLSRGADALAGLRLSLPLRREIADTLRDYLEYRLERRLRSSRFLREHNSANGGQTIQELPADTT